MTDAPEKLWVEPDGETLIIHNGSSDLEALISTGYLYEYTRTDVTEARIKELEVALRSIEEFRVGPSGQTVAERVMRAIACETLKGED
jgi:hypothetical protein